MDGVQTEMLQRITRVETKVDNMDEKLDRAIQANETAVEALQSAKSAHHRLDKIEDNQNGSGARLPGLCFGNSRIYYRRWS